MTEKRKEYLKEYNKEYYQGNREYFKEYQQNPNRKQYLKEYNKEYQKLRYLTDPMARLSKCMSAAMCQALKGNKVGQHWETMVGYTLQELLADTIIPPGLTIDDYGTKWVYHHKIWQSWWEFEKPEDPEFKKCWARCNLEAITIKEHKSLHSFKAQNYNKQYYLENEK